MRLVILFYMHLNRENGIPSLIKMMWLKAHLMDYNYGEHANLLFYIIRSRKCPPQHNQLIDFENDSLELVRNITFRKACKNFSDQVS